MTWIADAAMEARCRALVETLDLPHPLRSLQSLADAVGTHQGHRIQLRPLPPDIGTDVSGVVLRTRHHGDVISYPPNADPWWQLMCVSHELAHILCGHLGKDQAVTSITWLPDMQDAIKAWGPLYRCARSAGQIEDEAEFVATLLVQLIEGTAAAPPGPHRDGESLARFARVLEGRRDRRR